VAHQSFRGVRRFRLTPFLLLVAYRLRIFDHLGQSIDRLTIRPGDQVPVGIHGDLDGVVPHLLLHVGKGFPVSDEPGCKRVPQVVEADRSLPMTFSGRYRFFDMTTSPSKSV